MRDCARMIEDWLLRRQRTLILSYQTSEALRQKKVSLHLEKRSLYNYER